MLLSVDISVQLYVKNLMSEFYFLSPDACMLSGYSGGPTPDQSSLDKTIEECFWGCAEDDSCSLSTYTENFDDTKECKYYSPDNIISEEDKKSISLDKHCNSFGKIWKGSI